mgnify:CR=1 FL=1
MPTTQTVFITGGTSGIGLELAKVYLKQGWKVGVCAREEEKFRQHFDAIRDNIQFYSVDVADREALKRAIMEFSRPTGLGILIASAGISYPNKTKVPDFERTYRMVHVNLLGVMYAFEAALEVMIPQGQGQLVAISSLAGYNGLPGTSGYSATKSALMKFCETLTIDLAGLGVKVTCVNPGFVDTPLTQVNPHPMPFLVDASRAALIIQRGVSRGKAVIVFPFILGLIVRLLSILPRSLYRFLMTRKLFNYSKEIPKEVTP